MMTRSVTSGFLRAMSPVAKKTNRSVVGIKKLKKMLHQNQHMKPRVFFILQIIGTILNEPQSTV
jgi:hypothetical protein